MYVVHQLIQWFRTLNLFDDHKAGQVIDNARLHRQLLTTRVYLVLMGVALFILILFTGSNARTLSQRVSKPSQSTFERLHAQYADTLVCPCQEIAVPYSRILSIEFTYHQVCSSGFVSAKWIESLFDLTTTPRMTPLDYRLSAAIQFRLLNTICSSMTKIIERLKDAFLTQQIVTKYALSPAAFEQEAEALLDKFSRFRDMIFVPSLASRVGTIASRLGGSQPSWNFNTFHQMIPGSNRFFEQNTMYPLRDNISYQGTNINDFWYCDPLSTLTYKAGIYTWATEIRSVGLWMSPNPPAVLAIPGFRVGCTPYYALVQSTLECLFNSTCINMTAPWISNLPSSLWPKPLNSSLRSKYAVNEEMTTIYDQMMTDTWTTTNHFSSYYAICAATECTYTYIARFDLLYLITMLTGLFGGLIVTLRSISPYLVQFYDHFRTLCKERRQVHRFNAFAVTTNTLSSGIVNVQKKGPNEASSTSEDLCMKMIRIGIRCRTVLRGLNLFEDKFGNPLHGIQATRVYLILLSVTVLILTFYTFFTEHRRTIKVLNPSLDHFEQLYETYSDTLICSSVFLPPFNTWIWDYFLPSFNDSSQYQPPAENDFRNIGNKFFWYIYVLCTFSNEYITRTTATFYTDEFISSTTLKRAEFETHASILVNEFQSRTKRDAFMTLSQQSVAAMASGTENGISYQPYQVNNRWFIRRHSPSPAAYNVCACSVAYSCPDTTWSGGHFICKYGQNCTAGSIVWSVPGLIRACTMFETVMSSDLRCFFNQTCLNLILFMYNVDMPWRNPLSATTLAIQALNSSIPSPFRSDDTIRVLWKDLLAIDWNFIINYDNYYVACAPALCIYTLTKRLDIIHSITTVISLLGGLAVSLQLLLRVIVRLILWTNVIRVERQAIRHQDRFFQLSRIWTMVKHEWATLNLFTNERCIDQTVHSQRMLVISSRVYAAILMLAVFIVALFNGLTTTITSVTIQSPSLDEFEHKYATYSSALSCSCQRVAIPYGTFLSVWPTYHQVCASDFIGQEWISTLYGYGSNATSYLQLDRPLLSKQHQILRKLCSEAQILVADAIANLNKSLLVTSTLVSRASFESQTSTIIAQFIEHVPDSFRRLFPFLIETTAALLAPTAFNNDWLVEFGTVSNNYVLRNIPRTFTNSTCNCVISRTCQEPLRIGPPDLQISGLIGGCYPIDGLRMSTLECFYSHSCIDLILTAPYYFARINESFPNRFVPSVLTVIPLNSSIPSRFPINSSLGNLIDDLFIEMWSNVTLFENYFAACAPNTCQYHYFRRANLLNIATSILSLYGGLTIALRLIVWKAARIIQRIKRRPHLARVHPLTIDRSTSVSTLIYC